MFSIRSIRRLLPVVLVLLTLASCKIDEQTSPNGLQFDAILQNATEAELNLLVTGIESRIRNGFDTYVTASGSIARELYIFDADPRNTSDLLGKGEAVLDGNTFYLTAPYATRYRVIKNANILLESVDNANATVTEAQRDAYRGFANTMKALMLSQVLDFMGDNGIRVDVADPDNLGPFLSQSESYDFILNLFDMAEMQLSGAEKVFNLSSGFALTVDPDDATSTEGLTAFNRALSARVATRAGRYAEALDRVEDSFFDLELPLQTGIQHTFGTAAGDILNPLFRQAGQSGDQLIVHPRIINGIDTADARSSKFRPRVQQTGQDDLNSGFETALYDNAVSPIDIIRNEELILIWAEANLQTGDLEDAITGLNAIRNANGLDDLDDDIDDRDELIDALLYERTYSLWSEGHQMFDLRRYDRLNADFLPIDRPGDDIFTQFPVPISEGV